MAKLKAVNETGTLQTFVDSGMGDLQSLRDEMREWADNMSSNNMEHLPKYGEVSECADSLDQVCDDEPEVPEALRDTGLSTTLYYKPGKQRGRESRATRCDNALQYLHAVVDWCQSYEGELKDEVQTLADGAQNVIDTAEGVDFPGMY